jgi:hypothetical protein
MSLERTIGTVQRGAEARGASASSAALSVEVLQELVWCELDGWLVGT